jgi:hypothetical protein
MSVLGRMTKVSEMLSSFTFRHVRTELGLPLDGFPSDFKLGFYWSLSNLIFVTRLTKKQHSILYLLITSAPYEFFQLDLVSFLPCIHVYLAKTGHGPHSSYFVNCIVPCIVCDDNCVVLCIVWLCCSIYCFVCKCVLLPPGVKPIAVKYIISSPSLIPVDQWRTEGGLGGFNPPPPETPKLSQIPRSVENKSVTT